MPAVEYVACVAQKNVEQMQMDLPGKIWRPNCQTVNDSNECGPRLSGFITHAKF